jgi:hypothetical protein
MTSVGEKVARRKPWYTAGGMLIEIAGMGNSREVSK